MLKYAKICDELKTLKICLILFLLFLFFTDKANSQTLLAPAEYQAIQQRVLSYLIFPPEAKIKGWEGIVKIRFTLASDGRVNKIDIAKSSGYPLLDAAAMRAINNASPYPFPKDCLDKELKIILPISYEQPKQLAAAPAKSAAAPAKSAAPLEKEKINPAPIKKAPVLPLAAPGELISFTDLALKNNQPTQVAADEIKLAQFKVIEAGRNFFPGIKLTSYITDGQVYKVDFEEKETKFQIEQPLFYGGRLTNTFRQAKVNLEITQKNYDRLKFDVMHKTETAYYNLIASRINLKQKEALYQEGKKMLGTIEKLALTEMVIPLEVASASNWLGQIGFQIEAIKQDLNMAQLTFKQVLNVEELPKIRTQTLEITKLDLTLDKCLKLALRQRPEVYLSKLLVKFNDYAQKIEANKVNALTVDFTGSYSQYKGHYKTEEWKDAENWYWGIKVSKPWGASTVNGSYTSEKTQPRYGQTSATESRGFSGEFNLFDNMKRISDRKRADIDFKRALSDSNETSKTIAFEIEDAFLNYQKALSQLNIAEMEMKFRSSELEVTKIRSMVGETSLSSAIEALYALSESQTKYTQALANYHISLANLKKATGYGLQI